MRKTAVLAGLIALVAANAAMAEKKGFYVGADFGSEFWDINKTDIDSGLLNAFSSNGLTMISGSSSLDRHDITYSGFVGYRFIPYLAVEAAYLDLGHSYYKASGTVTNGTTTADVNASLTLKSAGPAISALGILPVGQGMDVYVRVGAYFADTKTTARIWGSGTDVSESVSKTTTEFLYGLGANYEIADRWGLRLEYWRIPNVGDKSTTGEANTDRYTFGVTYSF